MAFTQNNAHGKQNESDAKLAEAAKHADAAKQADAVKSGDAAKSKQAAEREEAAARAKKAARDGLNTITDLREKAAETSKKMLRDGIETASGQAREASERLTRTLGFSGQDSERLARQSKQNLEAVTRCGTVLTQSLQDASRNWFDLAQKQWQRNLDGMNKLARSQSLQEFTAIQSGLVREGLQNMVQDSRGIAETSLRAVEEAGKAFPGAAQQTPTTA